MEGKEFKTFKTIEIGTFKTVGDLRKALEDSGVKISEWAGDILSTVSLSKFKQTLDLVVLSDESLRLSERAQLRKIHEKIKNQDLDLCPAEVGPQLRLQYPDQPSSPSLVIAMKRIKDSRGHLGLFRVERFCGDLWLSACSGSLSRNFVFVRRK